MLSAILFEVTTEDLANQLGYLLCPQCSEGECAEVAENMVHERHWLEALTADQREELQRRAIGALVNEDLIEKANIILCDVAAQACKEWGIRTGPP